MNQRCFTCLQRHVGLFLARHRLASQAAPQTEALASQDPPAIFMESDRIGQFQHIWKLFDQKQSEQSTRTLNEQTAIPPSWLVDFCYEVQNPTDPTKVDSDTDQIDYRTIERFIQDVTPNYCSALAAAFQPLESSDGETSRANNGADQLDPYLDQKITIFPEERYVYKAYVSPTSSALPDELNEKLCLGADDKRYLQIGEAYAFPDRMQIPTSWGTEPAKLLVDPSDPTPVVYLQLSEFFPPVAWIPIKPSAGALRRVLTEFSHLAAIHRESHHEKYAKRWNEAKVCLVQQKMISPSAMSTYDEQSPNSDEKSSTITSSILRYIGWMARNVPLQEAPVREFPNGQDFFCGEYEHPEQFMEYLENCPFFFAVPEMRTDATEFWGQADGPGIVMSVFRCIYSKAVIWVKVHFSTEVKLPPSDPELFTKLWKEQSVYPATFTPVFIRVVWPDNVKMCGGGGLIRKLNDQLGTEFARDMPIDAAMALVYCTAWARRQEDLMGVARMRERLDFWEQKVLHGKQEIRPDFGAYPSTNELPSPMYSDKERLGMHLQYLAHLGDPGIEKVIRRWMGFDSGAVRLGCAKAALESGDKALFFQVVQSELPGRFRKTMLRCYRSRKKRDVYDKVERLHDEQFDRINRGSRRSVSLAKLDAGELETRMRLEDDPHVAV